MNSPAEDILLTLFRQWSGQSPVALKALPPSGSYREYYRLYLGDGSSVIGAWNADILENTAFLSFTKHFDSIGLSVPKVLAEHPSGGAYLLQDLGDNTLLQYVTDRNFRQGITPEVREMYLRVVSELPRFQVQGTKGLDYSVCYPRDAFDRQSMMWDLNYFKYYFLKLAHVPFDEQKLELDFHTLCTFLLTAEDHFFLYRDFQSRNVMIHRDKPCFIDYQGGRKGALQYDIASLLYEAKTDLSADFRQELLDYYIATLQKIHSVTKVDFMHHFYGFVFIRMMQAMGAYGFRGLYEKKTLFLQSIPLAVKTIGWLVEHVELPIDLPELSSVWSYIATSPAVRVLADKVAEDAPAVLTKHSENIRLPKSERVGLTVSVVSFSYKKGIPKDASGNGGGFVFDCRAVENPGRREEFKELTGRDLSVQHFLGANIHMNLFMEHVCALVDASVEDFIQRGFTHMQVSFGCTGGQHRSVFAADQFAAHLKKKYAIRVLLEHREQHISQEL